MSIRRRATATTNSPRLAPRSSGLFVFRAASELIDVDEPLANIFGCRVGPRDQCFDPCPRLWSVAFQSLLLAIRTESRLTSLVHIPIGCSLDGGIPNGALWLYSRDVNEAFFADLSAWLTQAGLAGASETDIVSGFCDRCVAAGLPLARALLFIDTLHPVHEGRLLRWGYGPGESPLLEYGRTSPDALAASGAGPQDVEMAERWRNSPHYKMLQTDDSFLRRRLNAATKDEFPVLSDFLAAGMTDYVAIISRFAPEGVIGEMDGVYSSWATREPDGFSDGEIAALQRVAPYLALSMRM